MLTCLDKGNGRADFRLAEGFDGDKAEIEKEKHRPKRLKLCTLAEMKTAGTPEK